MSVIWLGSGIQTAAVTLIATLGDATIGAIIGGVFGTVNTILAIYITRQLSEHDEKEDQGDSDNSDHNRDHRSQRTRRNDLSD